MIEGRFAGIKFKITDFFPVLGSQAETAVDHPRFPNTLKTQALHYSRAQKLSKLEFINLGL